MDGAIVKGLKQIKEVEPNPLYKKSGIYLTQRFHLGVGCLR